MDERAIERVEEMVPQIIGSFLGGVFALGLIVMFYVCREYLTSKIKIGSS